jgi:tetratricopeptide (TPR) repeat protein
MLLGHSLALLDRQTEAIARYRQFLATEPGQEAAAEALAGLGASLLKSGRIDEGLTVYEQLLTQAPQLAGQERLHLQLALLYRERDASEQAKMHLQTAAAGQDRSIGAEALYHLADLSLREGKTEDGKALLLRVTTQFASQVQWAGIAYYRLALLYEETQGWPEAWKAYVAAAATATDPKLVEAARGRARHLEETVDVHADRVPAPSADERK